MALDTPTPTHSPPPGWGCGRTPTPRPVTCFSTEPKGSDASGKPLCFWVAVQSSRAMPIRPSITEPANEVASYSAGAPSCLRPPTHTCILTAHPHSRQAALLLLTQAEHLTPLKSTQDPRVKHDQAAPDSCSVPVDLDYCHLINTNKQKGTKKSVHIKSWITSQRT